MKESHTLFSLAVEPFLFVFSSSQSIPPAPSAHIYTCLPIRSDLVLVGMFVIHTVTTQISIFCLHRFSVWGAVRRSWFIYWFTRSEWATKINCAVLSHSRWKEKTIQPSYLFVSIKLKNFYCDQMSGDHTSPVCYGINWNDKFSAPIPVPNPPPGHVITMRHTQNASQYNPAPVEREHTSV